MRDGTSPQVTPNLDWGASWRETDSSVTVEWPGSTVYHSFEELNRAYPVLPEVGAWVGYTVAALGLLCILWAGYREIFKDTGVSLYASFRLWGVVVGCILLVLGLNGNATWVVQRVLYGADYQQAVRNWEVAQAKFIAQLPKERVEVLDVQLEESGVRVLLDTPHSEKLVFFTDNMKIKKDVNSAKTYMESVWVERPKGLLFGGGWKDPVLYYGVKEE